MKSFVVISDLHLDWVTCGISRCREVVDAMRFAGNTAHAMGATLLCLGDITDPDNRGRTLTAQREAAEYARYLEDNGVTQVWLAGNHDVVDDGSGETTLACLAGTKAVVVETPRAIVVDDVPILCLPYPSLATAYDPEEVMTRDRGSLELTMVIGHLMVPGAQPGEETTEMPRGRNVRFPVESTAHIPYRLNGHYHQQQEIPQEHGSPVIIPGSLASLMFPGNTPGFLIIEVP